MHLTEYHWKSFDGLDLYAIKWAPEEQPHMVIAFVHGHGDHCRRYDEWFSKINDKSIAIITLDYRGHGRSQGKRGVIRAYGEFLEDISLLHRKATEFFPGIPIVLYGHSLGATIVLSYLLRSPNLPELAITTSPWLELKKTPGKWLSLFIKWGNQIAPTLTFRTGLKSGDFSSNEGFAEKREKDEFVHNRISARLFSEVEREAKWITAHFNEMKTPLLLMQGRGDKLMNYQAARSLSKKAPGQVNYREWKLAGHQLHNSEDSTEVMEYLMDWIKEGI